MMAAESRQTGLPDARYHFEPTEEGDGIPGHAPAALFLWECQLDSDDLSDLPDAYDDWRAWGEARGRWSE